VALSKENLKYWVAILTYKFIIILVYRSIKVESYYQNLATRQYGLFQGSPTIFLYNHINLPLHGRVNATTSDLQLNEYSNFDWIDYTLTIRSAIGYFIMFSQSAIS
jgi:hypothetical protein